MKKVKTKKSFNAFFLVAGILLTLFTALMFLLFLMAINTSLKSFADLETNKNYLGLPNLDTWQFPITQKRDYPGTIFGNYLYAFNNLTITNKKGGYIAGIFFKTEVHYRVNVNILSALGNTLIYVVVSSAIAAFVPLFMGYLCSKYKNKGSAFLYALVLFVIATPIIGATPATINLMRELRLYNTFTGCWLRIASFTNMYFLIYYAFFAGLSSSFDEAAEIDGASQLSVMFRICLPLASNIFWTIFLMMFVSFWNDYTTPMLYLPGKPTLSYLIYYRTTEIRKDMDSGASFEAMGKRMAVLMVFAIPIVIVFAIFNKRLMTNLTVGGVKE